MIRAALRLATFSEICHLRFMSRLGYFLNIVRRLGVGGKGTGSQRTPGTAKSPNWTRHGRAKQKHKKRTTENVKIKKVTKILTRRHICVCLSFPGKLPPTRNPGSGGCRPPKNPAARGLVGASTPGTPAAMGFGGGNRPSQDSSKGTGGRQPRSPSVAPQEGRAQVSNTSGTPGAKMSPTLAKGSGGPPRQRWRAPAAAGAHAGPAQAPGSGAPGGWLGGCGR